MLRQIVFVYRDEFVVKLVEKLMQRSSIACYGLSKVNENFAYVIEDLKPELIIVDEVAYSRNEGLINESLNSANGSYKSVLLSEKTDTQGFDLVMPLPLNVDTFVEQARSLVEK